MSRAFSSTDAELVSLWSSSQASQKSKFSSLYSERRNSRNFLLPFPLLMRVSNDWCHSRISSKVGISFESPLTMSRGVSFFPLESLELFRIVRHEQLQQQHQQKQQAFDPLLRSFCDWDPGDGWGLLSRPLSRSLISTTSNLYLRAEFKNPLVGRKYRRSACSCEEPLYKNDPDTRFIDMKMKPDTVIAV